MDDEDTFSYNSIAPGLPPASSDRQRWWLNNGAFSCDRCLFDSTNRSGLPASSNIIGSHDCQQPNPRKPPNPYFPSNEPDWIAVSSRSQAKTGARVQWKGSDSVANWALSKSSSTLPPMVDLDHPISNNLVQVNNRSTRHGPKSPRRAGSSASFMPTLREPTRKPAPPVPKKPAVLASPNNLDAVLERKHTPQVAYLSQTPRATSTRSRTSMIGDVDLSPPLHRNPQTLIRSDFGLPINARSLQGSGSMLPNRTNINNHNTAWLDQSGDSKGNHDLLSDDSDVAQNIPSLRPHRS